MRKFNTSGPNIPAKHYTIERKGLITQGVELVNDERYFTIWAPRQTGKSTFFYMLEKTLKKIGYKVAVFSAEDMKNTSLQTFLDIFTDTINEAWQTKLVPDSIAAIFYKISKIKNEKCVLIIDEIENTNQKYINDFLHIIRKLIIPESLIV